MATTIVMEPGYTLSVVCDHPATPASGGPVRFGAMTGIALTDESADGNASGYTSVYFGPCVVDLPVKGDDGSGSAVAVGDTIFFTDATTYHLDKTAAGYFFGFALETVESGSTTTIKVYHPASPGGGTLSSGGVGATQLATGAVTAIKLSATLKTGFIPLDIASLRIIGSNVIANLTEGLLLDGNTAPSLQRANSATDKALRVIWAASSSVEVQFPPVPKPPDLDADANLTLHLMLAKDTNTDNAVTVTAAIFDGVGGSDVGSATAALSAATLAEKTVTLTAANLAVHPGFLNIGLTPGTHTTDAIYLYAAWIEYTRA